METSAFRCASCRRTIYRRWPHGSVSDVEFTGRIQRTPASNRRQMPFRIEYLCKTCGHAGWSRHAQVVEAFQKKGGKLPIGELAAVTRAEWLF